MSFQPHPALLGLAEDDRLRLLRYRELVEAGVTTQDLATLRQYSAARKAWGGEAFKSRLEAELQRPVGFSKRGRPPRSMTV